MTPPPPATTGVPTPQRTGTGRDTPELAAAYVACRRIHAHHGRTYYLATRLLPRERRPHVWALYAFARVADEIVDNAAGGDPRRLLGWSEHAMAALRSPTAPDPRQEPVLAATWHSMRAYELDPGLVEEFLASMAMDLTVTRYPTWEDLRGYMRGSAAVIGELMAPVLGAVGADALHRAGTLGEAFQLTNFIRDVAEDLGRGRIYLPLEDLRRLGVDEAALVDAVRTGAPDQRVRSLVAFEVRRALALYEEARPGLAMVDRAARPCLDAAFTLYRAILWQVVDHDFDVFSGRLRVPRRDRAMTAGRVLGSAAVTALARSGGPRRPTRSCS